MATYKWSDPEFVDKIISEVKSQGHFDAFRKECLADVDTQPAYQNLHSRVEDTVQRFLNRQVWSSEIKNKNRLREEMRMNIIRAGFLESGVSRIVDQVVEQKMDYIQSKVEEILYNYVGIEKPKKEEKQNGSLEIDTALLPTDLEQVSPDSTSDKKSQGSIIEEEIIDEDFESPAFEPIEPLKAEKNENDNSENTNLSEISGLTSQDSAKTHKSDPTNIEDQNKIDTALSQISSTQDNIPDTSEMPDPHVANVLNVSGICGEEAQMATGLNDSTENEVKQIEVEKSVEQPKCQFDLKKDPIEFTGTERKSINLDDSTNSGESEKVIQSKDVQSMEVENLYENDTDSSEIKMEIDLKEETTQGTAVSSKIEESSQDSLKNKDKKSQKHDRSGYRSKSASHKSSRHHQHSSSSSKSKHDENSKHKSSSVNKSSSSNKKSSSKSRTKTEDTKQNDDHQQEKSSRRRRSTDHDSGDSKDISKPNNNGTENQTVENGTKENEKSTTKQPESDQQEKKTENKMDVVDEMEQESNKYDYLKSPCKSNRTIQDLKKENYDLEIDNDFHGFEPEELPYNPWFEFMNLIKSKKFVSNNNYISKKNDNAKTSKSKTPDILDSQNLSGDSEHSTPSQKSQVATQRYDANDLYKPKFDFSRRRRGQVMEDGSNKGEKETAPASN